MARRKSGKPRTIIGEIRTADFLRGKPYHYRSMECVNGQHADCEGCPMCDCHDHPGLTPTPVV